MAKTDCGVPLQKKIDVVIGLLTLVGAEKMTEDDPSVLLSVRSRKDNKALCEAILVAVEKSISHLQTIQTFLS